MELLLTKVVKTSYEIPTDENINNLYSKLKDETFTNIEISNLDSNEFTSYHRFTGIFIPNATLLTCRYFVPHYFISVIIIRQAGTNYAPDGDRAPSGTQNL